MLPSHVNGHSRVCSRLQISRNHHSLVEQNGKTFLYHADTGRPDINNNLSLMAMDRISSFIASLDPGQKFHGGHPDAGKRILRAGNLAMEYQEGCLRHISDKNNEIIRMIYPALRDKYWLTIRPVIRAEKIETGPDYFLIGYDCDYISGNIYFHAHYTISGNPDNTIAFKMEGEALSSFEKNRIGFCILHPAEENAGKICEITHESNKSETLEFPYFISPDQPFKNIRSMKWAAGAATCRIDFYGDIFETEDQRNWTDASFKTYSTPLEFPFPVLIDKGSSIDQRIEVEVEGALRAGVTSAESIEIGLDSKHRADIPLIGIARSNRSYPLSTAESAILAAVNFDHYRVDLHLFSPGWEEKAILAADEAARMKCPLEVALFFDNEFITQSENFIDWTVANNPDIAVILLFHRTEAVTPVQLREVVTSGIRDALPGVRIGFGTNANFAQLNRGRPYSGNNDLVCFSVHPQEHASDNETMVENLTGQGFTVESAAEFARDKRVWVSPVNIQRRFNANIEAFEHPPASSDFPPQADSRLMSLFGGCWTAGSIKYLARAGAMGITYYETAGERGIIQGDHDSLWPGHFASVGGMIFPAYHVFSFLLNDRSLKIIRSMSSQPLKADSIFLYGEGKMKAIILNFTPSEQKIILRDIKGSLKIKKLNEHTFGEGAADFLWTSREGEEIDPGRDALEIDPWSLVFIEGKVTLP